MNLKNWINENNVKRHGRWQTKELVATKKVLGHPQKYWAFRFCIAIFTLASSIILAQDSFTPSENEAQQRMYDAERRMQSAKRDRQYAADDIARNPDSVGARQDYDSADRKYRRAKHDFDDAESQYSMERWTVDVGSKGWPDRDWHPHATLQRLVLFWQKLAIHKIIHTRMPLTAECRRNLRDSGRARRCAAGSRTSLGWSRFRATAAGKMPASPGETECNAAFPRQCVFIGSSTIGTTGQPNIRPSNGGRDKARPSPARETRAVMCGDAGARTTRPPRGAFCRVPWQGVVFPSC